jgi:hypothetical protein
MIPQKIIEALSQIIRINQDLTRLWISGNRHKTMPNLPRKILPHQMVTKKFQMKVRISLMTAYQYSHH